MKSILAILLLTLPCTAPASQGTGRISAIWIAPDSPYVMFALDSPLQELHRCNESNRFSIDLRLVGGRTAYEALLMARANDLIVRAEGLNTCTVYDAENLKNLVIQ